MAELVETATVLDDELVEIIFKDSAEIPKAEDCLIERQKIFSGKR